MPIEFACVICVEYQHISRTVRRNQAKPAFDRAVWGLKRCGQATTPTDLCAQKGDAEDHLPRRTGPASPTDLVTAQRDRRLSIAPVHQGSESFQFWLARVRPSRV
ncbi:MAG: hypothetical protein WA988_07315 [Candidatus Nanopelagicales bacterium]